MTEWQCVYYTLTNVVTLVDGRIFFFFFGWLDTSLFQQYQTQGHAVGHIYEKLLSVYPNIYLFKNIEHFYNNSPRICIAVFVPGDIKHSHYLNVLLKYIRVEEKKSKINNKFHIQCILSGHQSSFLKMEWRKCRIGASFGKMFGIR